MRNAANLCPPRTKARVYTSMALNRELIDILACPKCKGAIELRAGRDRAFECPACKLAYAVVDDIPNFIVEEAAATAQAGGEFGASGRRRFFCGLDSRALYLDAWRDRRRSRAGAPADAACPGRVRGEEGLAGAQVQLCQAEDIAPSGMTIKRPRGSLVPPRSRDRAAVLAARARGTRSRRGAWWSRDALAGGFRRTGRALHRAAPRARAAHRRLLPPRG